MEMAYSKLCDPLPRFASIRRVPSRYQGILPLPVMQRYRCIVVGSARDALTVAIADDLQRQLIESLERLIGCPIFPVLVDSARMRLLLARLERREQQKHREVMGRPYYLHTLQLHAFLGFLLEYWR
jgi:MshEN domain